MELDNDSSGPTIIQIHYPDIPELTTSTILASIEFKILVGVFQSEYKSDEDWFCPNQILQLVISTSVICRKAKNIRERIDSEDAAAVRAKYNGSNGNPTFETIFDYCKGSERRVLKSEADLARRYRVKEKIPRPWDDVYKR
jgi:hypothetical protein